MNKFYGKVGYAVTEEVRPGVWRPKEVTHNYYGDWLRFNAKFQVSSNSTNSDVNVSNELSIIADAYAIGHFSNIRFVEFMGATWEVISVQPKHPRIILTIGGLYERGEQAEIAE